MSKKFLQRNEAAAKLGTTPPANGTLFASKADCITWGADPEKLAAYPNTHYPADDDIVPAAVPGQQFWIEFDSLGVALNEEKVKGAKISVEYFPA